MVAREVHADALRKLRESAVAPGEIAGVDLNPAMLEVARRLSPQITWCEGDAAALPFPDGSFDLVLSQAALMFFPDRAALREMGRVSGVDGRVVVQVPGRLSHSAGYSALARAVRRHAGARAVDLLGAYFAVGDPVQLRELFAAAGLDVQHVETWTGATRLASIDEFLAVELLPLADEIGPDGGGHDRDLRRHPPPAKATMNQIRFREASPRGGP